MTKEQALELVATEWWIGKSAREIAMFQLFEDRLCVPFDLFQKAMEESLGRPVFTHEFGLNREGLKKELLGEAESPTMQQIIDLIPEAKRIIVEVCQ